MITNMIEKGGSALRITASQLRPRQLIHELQRLRTEIEHLRRENMVLRGEVTRLRLYNEIEITAGNDSQQPISDAARKFFHILPQVFQQVEFFNLASDLGFSIENTQRIMDTFLRERLLVRNKQDSFEKADITQLELPFE